MTVIGVSYWTRRDAADRALLGGAGPVQSPEELG